MIELLIGDKFQGKVAYLWITRILTWLAQQIQERDDLRLDGVIVANDSPTHVSAMLVVEGIYQKRFVELLKQPPGEFKDKYIASVTEPEPVYEIPATETDGIVSNSLKDYDELYGDDDGKDEVS